MKKQFQSFLFVMFLTCALIFSGPLMPLQAKPYAVNYKLSGTLSVVKGFVSLHTEDGREYQLLNVSKRKARKFADMMVTVEGKAGKADDVEIIKVKKISEVPESDLKLPLPEYEAYQKAPALISSYNGKMVIENVRWDISQDPTSKKKKALHSWETAKVDLEKVINGYFILKPFAPKFLAAHSLFVFTFEPGGMVTSEGKESKALALSIEAHKKIGQTYGLIKTMKKAFNIVWLLTTWENYSDLNVKFGKGAGSELFVYPIKLTREQVKKLLSETISQACVNREGEYYNTIRNNCTNNLSVLLNRVTEPEKHIKLWKIPGLIYNLKATMPLSLAKLLKKKGIIAADPLRTISSKDYYTDIEAERSKK